MVIQPMNDFDPYELMLIPPNKQAEMIMDEIQNENPNIALIESLILLGANLDWRDDLGDTLLHIACQYNDCRIARILLESGIDLNKCNDGYHSPLERAVMWGSLDVIGVLLEFGLDINERDTLGEGCLHWCCRWTYLKPLDVLIGFGADINLRNNMDQSPLDIAILFGDDSSIEILRRYMDSTIGASENERI